MWFTATKESVPTMENPRNAIIMSKPLRSVCEPQEEGLIFVDEGSK